MPLSADDGLFDDLRAQSQIFMEIKHKCFVFANEAYEMGNKPMAKALSIVGYEYKKLMQKENQAASNKIFEIKNVKLKLNEIDLHGLLVPEAIEQLSQRVKKVKENKNFDLIVIVGRRLHSDKGPKIKPAVIEFANNNEIKYKLDMPTFGCIKLEFNKEDQILATKTSSESQLYWRSQ